jgi:hypothetical protein
MKTKAQQIVDYVEDNGPSTAAELGKLLNAKSGDIGGYCAHLVKNGTLHKDTSTRPFKYYKPGYDKPGYDKPVAPTPTADKILAASPVIDPPKPQAESLDDAIDALATALVGRISEVVEDKVAALVETIVSTRVAESIAKLTATLTKPDPLPVSVPKLSLPKVLVCGLLDDQQQMIRKEYSECLDIRFVGTNDNPSIWKSRATHVDRVFVMTSFVSHSHTEALKSCGIKDSIQMVSNGMSTLRDALTTYYTEVA